jgi:hypothetical protein
MLVIWLWQKPWVFFFAFYSNAAMSSIAPQEIRTKTPDQQHSERERENLWNTFGSPERKRTIAGDGSRLGHGRPSHWVTCDPRLGRHLRRVLRHLQRLFNQNQHKKSFLMPQKLILMSQKSFLLPQFNFGLKTKTYREKLTLVEVLSS